MNKKYITNFKIIIKYKILKIKYVYKRSFENND